MQQTLHSFDEVLSLYLGGNSGISLSIDVLHNFANSNHYDSVDYGPSILLWVMDYVASNNCNQYLVFNNIFQIVQNGETKQGVMIKVSYGMLMSFQGDTLHCGTTIHQDYIAGELGPPGNIYGIHFGLSMPSLSAFDCIEYINTLEK